MHPHITDVFALLDESRAALRQAVAAVPPHARPVKPAADRWSVNEVLEHLVLVERGFERSVRNAIEQARASGLGPEQAARLPLDAAVRHRLGDRSERRPAPEHAIPGGRMDDASAWAALEEVAQALRDAIGGADGLALGTVTAEHRRWGALTVYQWVEVWAGHEKRHAQQIAEIAVKQTSG
jgi:hypothetical protein